MPLTTDPKDPRLTHYTGPEKPGPQADVYLVLGPEERARGFVRPVRQTYRHVGPEGPRHPLRDLTEDEHSQYDKFGYVKFEPWDEGYSNVMGYFWTQAQLDAVGKACQQETWMGLDLAETYARDPRFYGATYCTMCQAHFQVAEFVWEDGTRVGS